LQAMGVEEELGRGAVRVSLGRATSGEQVRGLLKALRGELARLRSLSAINV
jgi:cysteine desulfurase